MAPDPLKSSCFIFRTLWNDVQYLCAPLPLAKSWICLDSIPSYKLTIRALRPPARGVYIPNLKEIAPAISEIRAAKVSIFFFMFSHTCKNCYKTQTRTPIALKFGTQKGSPKAIPNIKFSITLQVIL